MSLLACFPLWVKKVTRRFLKNNTSFSSKQHVVFLKTTRRFSSNECLFFPFNIDFGDRLRTFVLLLSYFIDNEFTIGKV